MLIEEQNATVEKWTEMVNFPKTNNSEINKDLSQLSIAGYKLYGFILKRGNDYFYVGENKTERLKDSPFFR